MIVSPTFKVQRATCQTAYRAFGAKEMAAKKQSPDLEATAAATLLYRDPRETLTTAELRSSLEEQTGKRKTC